MSSTLVPPKFPPTPPPPYLQKLKRIMRIKMHFWMGQVFPLKTTSQFISWSEKRRNSYLNEYYWPEWHDPSPRHLALSSLARAYEYYALHNALAVGQPAGPQPKKNQKIIILIFYLVKILSKIDGQKSEIGRILRRQER